MDTKKKYPARLMRQIESETRNLSTLEHWFSYILEDLIISKKKLENDKLYHQIEHSLAPIDYTCLHWMTDDEAADYVRKNLANLIDEAFTPHARKIAENFIYYKSLRKLRQTCFFWQYFAKRDLEQKMSSLHIYLVENHEKIAIAKASIAHDMCDAEFKNRFMEYALKYQH